MSVGIVEPKTHPSQLNAAEFLWDMKKRTSVFVQVSNTSALCAPGCGSCCPCRCTETIVLTSQLFAPLTLPFSACLPSKLVFLDSHRPRADIFRCTASAQSSLPGSTVGRRASPSGSRLIPLPRETRESTQSTSTLPPAKSKSLRSTCSHSRVEVGFPTLNWCWICQRIFLSPPHSAKRGRS